MAKTEVIEIKEVRPKTVTVHIVGDTDLVLNKMDDVTKRMLTDVRKDKAKKIETPNPWEIIITSIHWRDGKPTEFTEESFADALTNNAPCLTAFGLKKSFGEAVVRLGVDTYSTKFDASVNILGSRSARMEMTEYNTVLQGNCLDVLKTLEDKSIDCCVTSPPYYGLRDYGTGKWVGGDPNCPHRRMSKYSDKTKKGHAQEELRGNVGDAIYKTVCPLCGAVRVDEQIGLEETPKQYIDRLVEVFHEVKRVLKDEGTLWLNIGDSYCGTGDKGDYKDPKYADGRNGQGVAMNRKVIGCKQKDLIGIPWMLAFALRNDGWYLRQDIIWHKPNPMPESVKDRCVKSHEYIFLLSKKSHYYFDYKAIQEDAVCKNDRRGGEGRIEYDGKRSRGGELNNSHKTRLLS